MPLVDVADESYDYVIVGAGASGCVVANRLSRTCKTLLIEAGGIDSSWEILMPQNAGKTWGDERYSWAVNSTPQEGLKGKSTPCLLGKVLGGSASVNTLCWMRGHSSDYDSWEEKGVQGWSWKDVAPYFKRVEGCTFKCDRDTRGTAGPMKLTKAPRTHFVDTVLKAAEQLGWPVTEDLNGGKMEGFAQIESHTFKGVRWSPSQAYLHPVLHREKLHVLCHTNASKVIIEQSYAAGVEYLDSKTGDMKEVIANKEVIVCCGAILTPKVLLLSGIGPKAELEALGIEPVLNLQGVGKNLQAPISVPVVCTVNSNNYYYEKYTGNKKEMANRDWFVSHSGPHASFGIQVAASIKTDDNLDRPNVNFMVSDAIFGPFPQSNGFQKDHSETPGYSIMVAPNQCYSQGSVTLSSNDFDDPPLVDYAMLSDQRDVDNAVEGVRLAREVFEHEVLSDDVATVILPDNNVQSDNELEDYVREMTSSHGYYSGTCRMGSYSDPLAVTDSQGRVWGVGHLRVIDSSLIPDAPSGPLVSVCTMLAEKICDKIEMRDMNTKSV